MCMCCAPLDLFVRLPQLPLYIYKKHDDLPIELVNTCHFFSLHSPIDITLRQCILYVGGPRARCAGKYAHRTDCPHTPMQYQWEREREMGTVHSVDWSTTARGRSRLFTFLQIHFFFFNYILLLLLGTRSTLWLPLQSPQIPALRHMTQSISGTIDSLSL
jgi:hypothetical protein